MQSKPNRAKLSLLDDLIRTEVQWDARASPAVQSNAAAVREIAALPTVQLGPSGADYELNFDLLIQSATDGDRASWARLYNFAAHAMKQGFALPEPLQWFIADRLSLIGALLGDGDEIDNLWRNKLAVAVKGDKKLRHKSERRYNKSRAQLDHLVNIANGAKPGESHQLIADQLGISKDSAKRLVAPSKTKGSSKF